MVKVIDNSFLSHNHKSREEVFFIARIRLPQGDCEALLCLRLLPTTPSPVVVSPPTPPHPPLTPSPA